MSVAKKCDLCRSKKEAIYNLKDSIRPPKDLFYDGIGYLSAAFREILNVSARQPDRKICQDCHNEFQRVYHFIEECIRVEDQQYELLANIKEEPSLDVNSVTLLRISPVDIEAQKYVDELQDDTETDDRFLDNQNAIATFEGQFDDNNPVVRENNTLDDEICSSSRRKKRKNYDCTICGRKYVSANSLSQHRKVHMGITYNCRKCPAVFNFIQGRNSHERKHKANILKVPCTICGWMFHTSLSMKQHRLSNHTGKDQQIRTKATERESADDFDLDDETVVEMVKDGSIDEDIMGEHRNPDNGAIYKCDKCPAAFSFPQGHDAHEKNHKTGILKFPCDVCGWMFPTLLSVKQHSGKHSKKGMGEESETIQEFESIFDREMEAQASTREIDLVENTNPIENFSMDGDLVVETPTEPSPVDGSLEQQNTPNQGTIYKCDKCPATFKFYQGRNAHENSHKAGILKFPCGVCGWLFPTILSVRQHISRKHAKKGKHKTKGEQMKTIQAYESNYDEEMATISACKEEPEADIEMIAIRNQSQDEGANSIEDFSQSDQGIIYTCDQCPAVFNFHQGLNAHVMKHKAGILTFPCNVCGWMFPTLLSAKSHISRKHATKNKKEVKRDATSGNEELGKLQIFECSQVIKWEVDFEIATTSDHSRDERTLPIKDFGSTDEELEVESFSAVTFDEKLMTIPKIEPYCDDPVPENDEYELLEDPLSETSHSVRLPKPGSKPQIVESSEDPVPTNDKHEMVEDTLSETTNNDKRPAPVSKPASPPSLVCDVCNWKFPNRISLEHHRRVHELKPYACTLCDKKFSKPRSLQCHERFHGTELRYNCYLCDNRFFTTAELAEHRLDAHPEQEAVQEKLYDSDGNRIYKCEKCDTTYYTLQGFRHHTRTHLGATFCCTVCPRKFQYSQSLRVHMGSHLGILFKCRECDAVFKRSSTRKKHYIKAHTDITFVCDVCGAEFRSKDNLHSHQIMHRDKNIACSKCHVKCRSLRQLRTHELTRHRETKLYCDQCAAEFFDNAALSSHRRVHTGELFECNECKWKFMSQGELDLHGAVHKIANFVCEQCNAKFVRLRDFNAHKRIHTNDTFDCTKCPARFLFAGSLYRHKAIHKDPYTVSQTSTTTVPTSAIEEGTREVFSCDQCHVEYGTLHALELHKATHIENQYECTICLVKFAKRDLLRTHRLTHLGSKAFKCDECDAIFSKSIDFTAHKRMHSGDTLNCEVCNASFLRHDRLKEHMRIHTGETFDCDQCDGKFTTRWTLKKHALKHAAEKPFACDQCAFKTFYKNVMESHRQIHEDGYVGRRKKPTRQIMNRKSGLT